MEDAYAGCLAGLIAAAVTHPMDTLKARKIVGLGPQAGGLYRGFGTVALFCSVGNGIYFGSYEYAKERLEARGMGPLAAAFTAGLVANTATLTVWVPQDVLKERQQVFNTPAYRSLTSSARTILAEHGVKGMYRGAHLSFLMYTPLCAMYFMLYEWYKARLCDYRACGEEALTASDFAVGGAWAGGLAAFVTTPLDVLKVTKQVGTCQDRPGQDSWGALIRHGQPFRGAGFRVLSIAPNYALTIALWESCRRLF